MLPPKNVKFNSMKWLEIKFEFLLFLYFKDCKLFIISLCFLLSEALFSVFR